MDTWRSVSLKHWPECGGYIRQVCGGYIRLQWAINLWVSEEYASQTSYPDKYFFKIALDICLAFKGTTVHKSIINKCLVTAPALPYSKSVCKSQNRKCVCKSQKVCPYVCVSHKIENVCVSHKILIHQVLPRGSDREGGDSLESVLKIRGGHFKVDIFFLLTSSTIGTNYVYIRHKLIYNHSGRAPTFLVCHL